MPPRNYRPGCCAAALLFALLAAGCGGEELVTVTGTATRHGKPVPHVVVNFTPEKGLRSTALTDQDGKFKMVYTNGREGVLVGTHKVWVQLKTTGAKEDPEQQKRLAGQQRDPEMAQLLKKYGSAEATPINLDIKASQEVKLSLD